MNLATELQAGLRYIGDLAWDAEEDHYADNSGNMDRDIHGRVYALWDAAKLLNREFPGDASPPRQQIIESIDRMAAPLELEFSRRPETVGADLGGRVLALREVRAAIVAGKHMGSAAD